MHVIDPGGIVWSSFLLDKEHGKRIRTRIDKALDEFEGDLAQDSDRMKFVCNMKDENLEEIFTYN